jgi:2-phospho-L-lactate/phosphoenolpyruvate guanylyltransferase
VDAHVLVPLKTLDPKSRLAGALSPGERSELMATLLERVVGVVREAGVPRVTVVTREAVDGYEVWRDRGLAWNDALAAAMAEVVRAPLAAVVSADLPFLCAEEVEELLAATPERGIAIARARDGGTNAVAMRPPGLVRTRFGEPGSAAVHAALGVPHAVVDLPGLAFDVDTPADLEEMRQAACR